jgi:hypothetical protein
MQLVSSRPFFAYTSKLFHTRIFYIVRSPSRTLAQTQIFIVLTASSSRCFFISRSPCLLSSLWSSLFLVHSTTALPLPLFRVSTVRAAARQTIPVPEALTDHVAHPTISAVTLQLTVSPLMVAKLRTVNVPARMGAMKLHQASMDNVVATLHVRVVLGMEVAATSSGSARSMLPTVWLRTVVRKVWDNALKNLRTERVAAHTMRTSSMSALVLPLEFAARAVGSAVLTLSTVDCLVKVNSDHAWHRARMELVLGTEVSTIA